MKNNNYQEPEGSPRPPVEYDYFQPVQRKQPSAQPLRQPVPDYQAASPSGQNQRSYYQASANQPGSGQSGHRSGSSHPGASREPAGHAQSRQSSAPVRQSNVRTRQPGRRRRLTVGQKWGIAGAILGTFLLVAGIIIYMIWRTMMGQINIVNPTDETLPSEYNVPTESLANPVPIVKGITNILLLGVDNRDSTDVSVNERSDSMMILTVDTINNKIKLTSLQRDMAVYLPGSSSVNKINAANSFGGPALAMRVVNDTFRLNIKQYVVVNMRGMETIINVAGGVTVDVSPEELTYVNKELRSINHVFGDTPASPLLTKSGVQLLDGRQAVTYARIRKLDSDYKRMERQREVLQALMTSFMQADLATKTKMVSQGLGLITTNIPATDITNLGLTVLPMMNGTIEQLQIPINGYFREYSGASWMNLCDYNGMIPQLQQFIWGKTFSFDKVREIPGAPNSSIPLPTTHATTRATTRVTTKATTTTVTTSETAAPTTQETTTDNQEPTTQETTPETTSKPTKPTTTESTTTEPATTPETTPTAADTTPAG